jgi:hypothetical protein
LIFLPNWSLVRVPFYLQATFRTQKGLNGKGLTKEKTNKQKTKKKKERNTTIRTMEKKLHKLLKMAFSGKD